VIYPVRCASSTFTNAKSPLPKQQVGALLDSLASPADSLWPKESWPAMRFDRPLGVGAAGGHGPIRYAVEEFVPGRRVVFRFTGPRGFKGGHRLEILPAGEDRTILRHRMAMETEGPALLSWPLIFRVPSTTSCWKTLWLGRRRPAA
jgi:hypothetical protein